VFFTGYTSLVLLHLLLTYTLLFFYTSSGLG